MVYFSRLKCKIRLGKLPQCMFLKFLVCFGKWLCPCLAARLLENKICDADCFRLIHSARVSALWMFLICAYGERDGADSKHWGVNWMFYDLTMFWQGGAKGRFFIAPVVLGAFHSIWSEWKGRARSHNDSWILFMIQKTQLTLKTTKQEKKLHIISEIRQ